MNFSPLLLAYLDPSGGSIVMQLILGGAAGLGVALKLWWSKFRGRGPKKKGGA